MKIGGGLRQFIVAAACVSVASPAPAQSVDYSVVTNKPAIPGVAQPMAPLTPAAAVPAIPATPAPGIVPANPYDRPPSKPPATRLPAAGGLEHYRNRINENLQQNRPNKIFEKHSMALTQGVARATVGTEPEAAAASAAIDHPILFNSSEADAILASLQIFPPDNPWNQIIYRWPTHPNSARIIAAIGPGMPLRVNQDMAFVLVPPTQSKVAVKITTYPEESDPGPYPVPDSCPIEGWPASYKRQPKYRLLTLQELQHDLLKLGGDRHAIVVDPVNGRLYEFFGMYRREHGWEAAQASIFNLRSNELRPAGWTSADAAGLPIFPAVVRYDEIAKGVVNHALRVTVPRTRRAYVAPATHFASRLTDPNLPRMGERLRLRKDFDLEGFSPAARAILGALKSHGMFVADNGNLFAISVAPDPRIPDISEELGHVSAADFEVVVAVK